MSAVLGKKLVLRLSEVSPNLVLGRYRILSAMWMFRQVMLAVKLKTRSRERVKWKSSPHGRRLHA